MAQNTLPDYHFLMIPSTLGAEWFFDAARAYWERFRPTVISDFELLTTIPEEFSVNVTVIARRDRTVQLGVELAQAASRALFDPLIYDLFDDTKAELNRRAAANEPFGVPLIPTATPTPGPTSQPLYPTVGAVPIQGAGFITQTPTPDLNAPEILPTPTPAPNELTGTPQEPIYPTPGPVITGNN